MSKRLLKLFNYLPHIVLVPYISRRWRKRLDTEGLGPVIQGLEPIVGSSAPTALFIRWISGYHKVCSYYLQKIARDPNPCVVASLLTYEKCRRKGVVATIVVGADKEAYEIKGHCWIEIDTKPINENCKIIQEYTRMIEK